MFRRSTALFLIFALASCKTSQAPSSSTDKPSPSATIDQRLAQYAAVRLEADLSPLSDNERKMIPLLIEAADHMNSVFWQEAYGDRESLLAGAADDKVRRLLELNYGPWDRLRGNEAFIDAAGDKPKGAAFYPADMTKEIFEAHLAANPKDAEAFKSLYTVIRRTEGGLRAIPYHEAFAEPTRLAADKLDEAAALAEDAGLAKYLKLRAKALRTDEFRESDLAWMDMKTNRIDVVIGPIETYEDQLYGYKAAHEAYVLIKDLAWSERLARYTRLLPQLQVGLPVPEAYKKETPGSDSDLNAYDVIYYSGDCNSGSKTIAINLPNDETVQLEKGTRRLQLKNAIRAKFDRILVPIANTLIDEDQLPMITFDAFFNNIMFHEVAHGLGIKETINGKGKVRAALKEQASSLEEGKADILGLYMIDRLYAQGEIKGGTLKGHYVTFLAGIFRSIRFGASSAHGRANMLRFNFFKKMGAFSRNEKTGRYSVDFDKIGEATAALSKRILELQGNGDYEGASQLMKDMGTIDATLQADLDRLSAEGIPVDVVFEQGTAVLGL